MTKYKKLKYEDLVIKIDFLPDFKTTEEIANYCDLIGQERAIQAIEMGLKLENIGYNIYVSGISGSGKKKFVLEKLKEIAKNKPSPEDWCYVYNFNDPLSPIAINLKAGTAEDFKNDIESLINSLFDDVPKIFSDEEYEKERENIIDYYQKNILNVIEKLHSEAKKKNFVVKSTKEGFVFIPLKDNEEMNEEQYNELSSDEKNKIAEDVKVLKLFALDVLKKTKSLRKEMLEKLKILDENKSYELIGAKINILKEKYGYNKKIIEYLDELQKDLINNIDVFLQDEEEGIDEEFFKRYYVNIMTCNKNEGAPVVFEENPEFNNLIGVIEYENDKGAMITDFTMIKPGSLHKANGGYLVIDAIQLLSSYQGWKALKNSLKNNCITIENLRNQLEIIPIVSLKPEKIPLNVKVVLLGSEFLYYLLYLYDEEFKELFSIKAEFDSVIKNTPDNVNAFLGFVSLYCSQNNYPHISNKGFIELYKYALRLAESRRYFTARFRDITNIIDEACVVCKERNGKSITEKDIKKAIVQIENRHSLYKDKVLEMYKERKYIIQLSGYKIGEINALSVIDLGDYSFGKQNRITVTTYRGKGGVINIEREVKMSGTIHDKGVLILTGYLGQMFGQRYSLSFNASICFEQLYGGIEGDSASAAELIALISSLGDIPIKQSIAITGSVNQRGEIQPVGGINEKIEGFFEICKIFGLDGSHGVIIPSSNVSDLILKDEVLEAVRKGLFNIYAVDNIEECFEILCDEKITKKKNIMEFIREKIENKLKLYNEGCLN
ncbi:lon-related putative ATP-dependent protease [Caloramator fervidus]|uniref:endopeptidase La n=1 Tax=Caloramator fervidus TaxID=29344 RepID=A0A1H5USW0_9CLOT|nr:ATP-binding protein [Caloramator fervidus]SEF77521.1 lon-related putative ATP-dependent protease [Caloramator fervidus]